MLGEYGVAAVVIRDNEASDGTFTHQLVAAYVYVGDFEMHVSLFSNDSWSSKSIEGSSFDKAIEIRDELAERVPEAVEVEFEDKFHGNPDDFTDWMSRDHTDDKVMMGQGGLDE